MSYYPTEEEEFELLYGDELELMNEMDDENRNPSKPTSSTATTAKNPTPTKSPRPGTSKSFFQNSPALSQISQEQFSQQHVNRRLFGTPNPQQYQQNHRIASTPFSATVASPSSSLHLTNIEPIASSSQNPPPSQPPPISSKRRLEDLFGDINDINDDDPFNYNDTAMIIKKPKTEAEIELEMIDKILAHRKQLRMTMNPLKKNNLDKLEALHEFKKRNLSESLPKWPFITMINDNQDRLYVRMHSEEFEDKEINEISFDNRKSSLLFGGSAKEEMWRLAQKLTEERLTRSESIHINANDYDVEEIHDSFEDNGLWVEKYRPKKYLDLLSDETTNRSLLSWIKLWDKVVFNRAFNAKSLANPTAPPNSFNKKTGKFEAFGNFRKKSRAATLNTDVDDKGRPMQKIALLCGPPGLGKTTLAHTIARHAGYNVREINASDDRSPEAFKIALENGTQMKSVLSHDKRPNCIILDEIDGAPIQSVEYLIKFVSDNVTEKSSKKGGARKSFLLKRPIICICNDMYVPALRQLRQIAFVVNFPSVDSSRLADRLQKIARREHIKTDMTALLALAEKTGNDVRSCLGMIQFYNSTKKPLTIIDVLNSNIGQKDQHKGLFSVWGSIFQIQKPGKSLTKDEINGAQVVSISDITLKSRMETVLDVVHSGGDYERLMTGVFENYLTQKMPDPNMNGVANATEWFCFSDRIQRYINQHQNYSIYPYLQYGFVAWHFLFAALQWPKINFPNKGYEYSQKSNLQRLIQSSLRKGLCASTRGVGDGQTIIIDTIPLLRKVLCPSLRSVSLQLLSPKERADLRHAVEVMADLGIVYIQIKSTDGTYQYQMEPDIDVLGRFEETQGPPLNYWSRQIIAREVELERMRRAAPKASTSNENTTKATTKPSTVPNHLQKLKPKAIRSTSNFKETMTKDFFGRVTSKKTEITVKEGGTDVIVKSPIWYRYKEGFNNAVRKDITIMDIL